jgi:Glycosyltransferase 61
MASDFRGDRGQNPALPEKTVEPAANGSAQRDGQGGLPDITLFRDIAVVPAQAFYNGHRLVDGGPVWPDFERQTSARFGLGNTYIDRNPRPVAGEHPRVKQPCLWGGYARAHFGHFVAEHATRLLWSVRQRPDDRVLFVLAPQRRQQSVPAFLWDVTGWFGVPRDSIRFVRKPMQLEELRVMPQAEHLGRKEPPDAYLDLLDENVPRQGLKPVLSDVLYVTRNGMLAKGQGAHAGESYLIERLRAGGATVLDPAERPLREQLALYLGARVIVFAEGSALHGRQLIGRVDQTILVLNRRPGSRTGEWGLRKRVAALSYVEATAEVRETHNRHGQAVPTWFLSEFDLPTVFDTFRGIGIDLAPGWDIAAYRAAADADIDLWTRFHATRLQRKHAALHPDESGPMFPKSQLAG